MKDEQPPNRLPPEDRMSHDRRMDRVDAEVDAVEQEIKYDVELMDQVKIARLVQLKRNIGQAQTDAAIVYLDCPTQDVVDWYLSHIEPVCRELRLTSSEIRKVKRNLRPRVYQTPRQPNEPNAQN